MDNTDTTDTTEPTFIIKTPLLNQAKVRALALALAQQRARKFTRASNEFFVGAEAALRNYTRQRVANPPPVGITLR